MAYLRNRLAIAFATVSSIAASSIGTATPSLAKDNPPRVEANGGLIFQSQGGGTPNTFTGYLFAPLSQGEQGEVLFFDVAANLNLGGALAQQNNVNAAASTRLGYRWLSSDQRWIYGFNAGVDTRQAYSQYAFQAGVGAEALNRNLELRANGYIPFSNQADRYATGWSNAYLSNNQLILDGWYRYVVSLGGVNLEAGIPLKRWGKDSLWLYGAYYTLGGSYLNGSSGLRGRAEVRVGSQLSVGATLSYDNIFELQATGYLRYGAKPIAGSPSDAITDAERNFLALRGLPMQRETDIRMVSAQQDLPGTVSTNPASGAAWVVRCTGNTSSTFSVNCEYPTLDALLAVGGANDVLLVGGGAATNLAGRPLENGRPTLRLAVGTQLGGSGAAPTLNTQFGAANLTPIFGATVGAQPAFSNGVISIGSNTTISGFSFSNTSITNYSTSNVVIANNSFVGSYTDNPTALSTAQSFGAINVSANALPAIQLQGVDNLTVDNNTFIYPQTQTYQSQRGADGRFVCNQKDNNPSGLCLSANAVRLNNSTNAAISNNIVRGALDEAFRINNPSGTLLISNNNISEMRMGPDSNIGSAIIIGQNQGASNVQIVNNTISNNSRGIYPTVASANASGVSAATSGDNVIDPIELGLCRGTSSYPRSEDLYADSNFSGNCSSTATMNLTVSGNTINLPAIREGFKQQGDGIDFNIGTNGALEANVFNNNILTLGEPGGTDIGDNGLTFDIRGSSRVTLNIFNNTINNSGDSAINFSLQNTNLANQPGLSRITIYGNELGQQSDITSSLEIDLVKNVGTPTSQFYVENRDQPINIDIDQAPFNIGPFPDLYYNGQLWQP